MPDEVTPTEVPEVPEDLTVLEGDALLDLHGPLSARRAELLAAPATIARNTELATVTAELNRVTIALNGVRTTEAGEVVALEPEREPEPEPEAPAEVAPVEPAAGELVVTAAAAGAASTAPVVTTRGNRREAAPIVDAADGSHLDLAGLGSRMAAAASLRSGVHVLASVDKYAAGAARLGSNAVENHAILFGAESRELTMTAAICGPAEPIKDVPICFTDDEPVLGTLNDRPIQFGQIQLYAPIALADIGDVITIPAPDCENCAPGWTPATIDCGTLTKCEPLPAIKAEPILTCMCLPESFMWSAPHMIESALKAMTTRRAAALEQWRLAKIREQSYVRTFTPAYGASRAINHAAFQALANINNGRFLGTGSWIVMIPRGFNYAVMADLANAAGINFDASLADLVKALGGNTEVVEYLDNDPTAPGLPPVQLGGALGNAGSKALDDFHQTPAMYVYDRSKFLTGSLGKSEIGLDYTDPQTVASGCRKVMMREWQMAPVAFGCSPSLVVDFTEVCASGKRPDMVAPYC